MEGAQDARLATGGGSVVVAGNGDNDGRMLVSVLAARSELADISLERQKETLKQELAWSQIRAKR